MRNRQTQPPEVPTDVRILDIAAEHVRRYGLGRTTVTQIAEEAAMSHANVYRYYPSKAALIDEITTAWLKPIEAELRIIADAPDPAFDKVERMIFAMHRAYRDKLETDPKVFALFADATQKGHAVARKHRNRCQLEVQRALEEGTRSLFDVTDQKRAVTLTFDALHRFVDPVAIQSDVGVSGAALLDRATQVFTLLIRTLASKAI